MYSDNHLSVKEAGAYLGLGRNRTLKLCQERTHGFPAVKNGNKYIIDKEKLSKWYEDWYAGKFEIS